jgi:hypothetical protein
MAGWLNTFAREGKAECTRVKEINFCREDLSEDVETVTLSKASTSSLLTYRASWLLACDEGEAS